MVNVTTDFPFMADLPKSEQAQVKSKFDQLQELALLVSERGLPVPPPFAGKCLGVSVQRVHQLLDAGQLESFDWYGDRYVTKRSLVARMQAEKPKGRPRKEKT